MLFELGGRRKRFIQVIYVFLALLLGGGLVFMGIGGDAQGGLLDAFGLGTNSSTTTDSPTGDDIEKAEEALAADPNDEKALLLLARSPYIAGQQALEIDDQGQAALSEESIAAFEASIDAWESYLETRPDKPDDEVATVVFQAYGNLAFAGSDPALIQDRLEGATETAQIVAEAQPGPNSYLQLATYAYLSGDPKLGAEAGKKAEAEADEASLDAVKSQLEQAEQQGKAIQKQLAAEAPTEEDLQNPLQGLGGTTGAPAPAP
jgi:hypothetical protein